GELQIGIISSLGSRRDAESVAMLGQFLTNSDQSVARSAAMALGTIGSPASAAALQKTLTDSQANRAAIVDGLLNCAESLLASHHPSEAASIYKQLAADNQSRLIRLAATRGLLACASHTA